VNPDCFQRNLTALRASNPSVAAMLERQPAEQAYRCEMSRDGWPVLVDPRGESFASLINPLDAYRKRVRQSVAEGDCIPVLLGWGCGYAFLAVCLELGSRMTGALIAEPDTGLFRQVLHHLDLSKVLGHPGLRIVLGEEIDAVERAASDLLPRTIGAECLLLKDPVSWKRHRNYLQEAERTINALLDRAKAEARFCSECGPQIQENLWRNAPLVLADPPVGAFEGKCADCPAVLVSAGPSLAHDLAALASLKSQPLIICVDTAYPILQRAGVEPHVVVSCDPTSLNRKHLDASSPQGETILAYDPEVYFEIPQHWPGPRIVLNAGESPTSAWLRELTGERARIRKPISVVHAALETVLILGCDPVVLLGCDFAYAAEGGESHVPGTVLGRTHSSIESQQEELRLHAGHGQDTMISEPLVWLPGKDGGCVPASATLAMFAVEFERLLRDSSSTVIDAGHLGARIAGTRRGSIEEIANSGPFCRERLREELKCWTPTDRSKKELMTETAKRMFARTAAAARKGLSLCRGDVTPALLEPIESVFWEIHRDRDIQRIFGLALYPATLHLIRCMHSNAVDEKHSALRSYFEAVLSVEQRLCALL